MGEGSAEVNRRICVLAAAGKEAEMHVVKQKVHTEDGLVSLRDTREMGVQTLKGKFTDNSQCHVRLQTDVSYQELEWRILKRKAKAEEDMEKTRERTVQQVQEDETKKVLRGLRTTMLILNDRRNEAIGWKDEPVFPWDSGKDVQDSLKAQAGRVKKVEDIVKELRKIEAQLSEGRRGHPKRQDL